LRSDDSALACSWDQDEEDRHLQDDDGNHLLKGFFLLWYPSNRFLKIVFFFFSFHLLLLHAIFSFLQLFPPIDSGMASLLHCSGKVETIWIAFQKREGNRWGRLARK